jgi:hypothetical protein
MEALHAVDRNGNTGFRTNQRVKAETTSRREGGLDSPIGLEKRRPLRSTAFSDRV